MITIEIYINLNPIHTISAINTSKINANGETIYECFKGLHRPKECRQVAHIREDGAIQLAHKMLKVFEIQ